MKYLGYVFVILFAVVLLMPLVWMIAGSFQPNSYLMRVPPSFVTNNMGFQNYKNLFYYPISRWTINSLVVSAGSTILLLVINLFAGYAFAKKSFHGKKVIFSVLLLSLIIPSQITLIPSFLIIKNLGLYNSLWAVILPSGTSAMIIFLFRQYIEKIPDEFFSMATIDGCGELQKIRLILIPLAVPMIATVFIMGFIGEWNNFLWQMIVLSKDSLITVPIGVSKILAEEYRKLNNGLPGYGTMMAGAVYSFLPMLAVFVAGQKWYLKNLFGGGLK